MKINLQYIALFLLILLVSCDNQEEVPIIRDTISMGTNIQIKVYHEDEDKANKAITEAIAEIERINQKYSTYIRNNFMDELNSPSIDTLEVDDETLFLLKKSDEIHEITEGTFDAAIGNLIKLIGFEDGNPHLPSQDSILMVLQEVGWKHIEISHSGKLIKNKPVTINFGGIAKGYAVDKAFEVLMRNNIQSFLINAGGEVKGYGREWKIGIQHPRIQNELLGTFVLNNVGVATSGDYEQYFNKDKKRFSHIINPVNGMPSDECQSVSIISASVTDADGIATGIFILGPKKGIEIIDKLNNIECLIVDNEGKIYKSSGIGKYLKEEN